MPIAQALLMPMWQCSLETSGIERILCSWLRTFPDLVFQGHSPLANTSLELFPSYRKGQLGHTLSLQAVSLRPGVDSQSLLDTCRTVAREAYSTLRPTCPFPPSSSRQRSLQVMLKPQTRAGRSHGLRLISKLQVENKGLPGKKQHAQLHLTFR